MIPNKILGMAAITRGSAKRLAVLFLVIAAFLLWAYLTMIRMPGKSYSGPLMPLTGAQTALRDALRRDVEMLASEIGPRGVVRPIELAASADFIERSLQQAGYDVQRQCFDVHGVTCCNLVAQISGSSRADQIIVIGGHYDSVLVDGIFCPGANDNASGVAATLALASAFGGRQTARTLRFVFFVNEEPPYFQQSEMGSWVYAKRCQERDENIVAMLSLETIGCYSDERGSQKYPFPLGLLYPSTGNFITFVGNVGSRKLVRESIGSFRRHAKFPSEGGALPGSMPGVGWSDHWAFWQEGYPAIMVTDTAPYRYPHYHQASDTPDKLDYDRMARVVEGLEQVVVDLANPEQ